MPSIALHAWQTRAQRALDEVEAAHAAVGGAGRGRRFATRQINHAYVVLLCSHFQRFCRDLHTEAGDYLIRHPSFSALAPVLRASLSVGLKLNVGNANPGNIGSDFAKLGVDFWTSVYLRDRRNKLRQQRLDEMHRWRNAIAHQDFSNSFFAGREMVRLAEIRSWRSVCECLAVEFDAVIDVYLRSITGVSPW
jgi:hypothetical protein